MFRIAKIIEINISFLNFQVSNTFLNNYKKVESINFTL